MTDMERALRMPGMDKEYKRKLSTLKTYFGNSNPNQAIRKREIKYILIKWINYRMHGLTLRELMKLYREVMEKSERHEAARSRKRNRTKISADPGTDKIPAKTGR